MPCVPCNSTRCFYSQQLISTATFKTNQAKRTFKIYHEVNYKTSFVIYRLEYYIWKLQYVCNSETSIYIRLNNHRRKMSKIPMQYQLSNISACMIMTLTIMKNLLSKELRNIRTISTELLNEILKQSNVLRYL